MTMETDKTFGFENALVAFENATEQSSWNPLL